MIPGTSTRVCESNSEGTYATRCRKATFAPDTWYGRYRDADTAFRRLRFEEN